MSDNSESARLVELDMSVIGGHEAEHLRSEILRLQSELSEAKARVAKMDNPVEFTTESAVKEMAEAFREFERFYTRRPSVDQDERTPLTTEISGRECMELAEKFGDAADLFEVIYERASAEARARAEELIQANIPLSGSSEKVASGWKGAAGATEMKLTADDLNGLYCRAKAAQAKGQKIEIGPDFAEAIVALAFRGMKLEKDRLSKIGSPLKEG